MKGTKRLFATILATVMMFCMSVTAFAEPDPTPPPTYKDMSEVTITVKYDALNADLSPEETFTVKQVGDGTVDGHKVNDGGYKINEFGEPIDNDKGWNIPDITQDKIEGAFFGAGDAGKDYEDEKPITIKLPEYNRVGVYEYTLIEVDNNTAGVTYYDKDITLVVTVIQQGDVKIRIATVKSDGEKNAGIENTYSAGALQVTKTVEGNLGDRDKYFEFRVALTGEQDETYADSYKVIGGSYTENPTTIKFGTLTTFYLKHDETLSILNLPYDVSYTVVETDYSKDGYTTSVSGVEEELVGEGTIKVETQTVEFVNTKEGEIDTGINLDSLPYILIFAGVIVAAVVMIARKRRISD